MENMVSVDFFTVPTLSFNILYIFVVLSHHRRQILHFNVTSHPTAEWTTQQVVEAFPWDSAPKYLLRDRDKKYGEVFRKRVSRMGIEDILTAYRSPWQNPLLERLIGSIRRERLDHVIAWDERHLRSVLSAYIDYYHQDRTHLELGKETPLGIQERRCSSRDCEIIELARVGGLHHRYAWQEAA